MTTFSFHISRFRQLQKILSQISSDVSASCKDSEAQIVEPCAPQVVRKLMHLQQEAIFRRLRVSTREITVIMGVRSKTVTLWLEEAMEYLRHQQKMKVENSFNGKKL